MIMSNEIYGFADLPILPDLPMLLNTLRDLTPLGIFSVSETNLVGFPLNLRPSNNSLVFVVGDSPESMNAEYILDYQDYDPKANIGLPVSADERLSLFTTILSFLFTEIRCKRIVMCLTECNQIYSVKYLNASEMSKIFNEDCSRESPPCVIYVVTP
jgi:hypothetical protein